MPTSSNEIELTKDEVGSLLHVYVNHNDYEDNALQVCEKLGVLFGMFFDPSVDKIHLRLEEQDD